MSKEIFIKKIEWFENGLWDNNGKITIHIPIFKEEFNIQNIKNLNDVFFYNYDDSNNVDNLHILYIDLNDIVFKEKSWFGFKRANVVTTI